MFDNNSSHNAQNHAGADDGLATLILSAVHAKREGDRSSAGTMLDRAAALFGVRLRFGSDIVPADEAESKVA